MTNANDSTYDSGAALDERLNRIFGQYRPVIEPEEEDDAGESTDDLLKRVLGPDEFRKVEAHRARQAEEAAVQHNKEVLRQALQEAADAGVAVGTWDSFRQRMEEADNPTTRSERHAQMANDAAEAARQRYEADLRESLAGLPEQSE